MDLGRYQDKPFLLFLEAYVLHSIGHLSEGMEQLARQMAKKFFGPGDWKQQLMHQVGFDASLGKQLKQVWTENQRIAKGKGIELDPADFARALVEENFSEIIEMATSDLEAEDPKEEDDDL